MVRFVRDDVVSLVQVDEFGSKSFRNLARGIGRRSVQTDDSVVKRQLVAAPRLEDGFIVSSDHQANQGHIDLLTSS